MGNLTSSCFKGTRIQPTMMIKLIDSQGNLRLLSSDQTSTDDPVSVAELMLDNPGLAVSQLDCIRQTRRIPAMKADEALSAGGIYLLVPVGKVNSRVTDSQMAAIDDLLSNGKEHRGRCRGRGRGGSFRVSPEASSAASEWPLGAEEAGDEKVEVVSSSKNKNACGDVQRIQMRWSPVLDPIVE